MRKRQTQEHRAKVGAVFAERMWITDGMVSRRVDRNSDLPEGWVVGRPADVFVGRKHSTETKEKMSAAKRGKTAGPHSTERRAALSLAAKTRKRPGSFTQEHRDRISVALGGMKKRHRLMPQPSTESQGQATPPLNPVGPFFAYLVTNLINSKTYLGITSTPDIRWMQHIRRANSGRSVYALHRSIAKHGVGAFSFEVVASAKTWNDLLDLERLLIEQHGSYVALGRGYNMTRGGEGMIGFTHTDGAKRKMSKARSGRKLTPEHKAKVSAAGIGRFHTEESKAKMRRPKTPEHIAAAAAGRRVKISRALGDL